MILNPLINYDTKYNFLHPYSQRFIHRFLVPYSNLNSGYRIIHPSNVSQSSIQKTKFSASHTYFS